MRKKLLATLMIATLCLAGCQSSTQTNTPVETPTATTAPTEAPKSTDETTPTETICPTEAVMPTDAPSSEERGDGPTLPEITEAPVISEEPIPTEVPVVTEEPVITEEPVVEPTEEPTMTEVSAEPTVAPKATVAPIATPLPTSTPVPTATPTPEPTAAPEPTPTVKPEMSNNILWDGKEYVDNEAGYGPENGTITLETIGTKVPTLLSYNDWGVSDSGKGWIGKTADEEGILHDVLGDIRYTLIDKKVIGTTAQAFLYTTYNIGFSYTMGSEDIHLQRDPNSDTYTLTINRSLKKDEIFGVDYAAYNKDIVKVFCSIVSSQPELLFSTLLEDLTGDVCISEITYTTVGDCLVRFETNESANGHYVYSIKSATSPKPTKAPDLNVEISDKILWEGKDYVENNAGYGPHNGTITLNNIGTKIPLLSSFNEFAIDEGNKGWIGDTADKEGILGDVLGDIRYTMIRNGVIGNTAQGFLYTNYCISWSYMTGVGDSATMNLKRDPTTDTYTFTLNADLQSYELMGVDYAAYNRDMVKVFLSIFSSTPEEVYEYLYEGIYENGKLLNTSKYKPVGDCQVKLDKTFSFDEDGKLRHIKFYFIAP